MKIYLASDHAGFDLKEQVKNHLIKKKYLLEDLGTHSKEPVNWAEFGAKAAARVSKEPEESRAITICGSGIGMSMIANKFKKIRAALCNDEYAAEMSRKHNNANVLTMGARVLDLKKALKIVNIWLNTKFEGERHQKRISYMHDTIEKENFK